MKITEQQKQDYRDKGYFIARNLIPHDQLETIRERLDMAALGKLDSNIFVQVEPEIQRTGIQTENPLDRIRKVSRVARYDPFFQALAADENILELMRGLLGNNLRFFGDECQLKPAYYGSAHAWHQDAPYFYREPLQVATVWIAIDRATCANGCIEVVPGAHKHGILERRNPKQAWFDADEFDTSGAVYAEIEAGDALIFDILLPHGSGANRTPNRRRSVIYRYINTDGLTPETWEVANRHGALVDDPDVHPIFHNGVQSERAVL